VLATSVSKSLVTTTWAARYNTWLIIKLTPKGIVFFPLFFPCHYQLNDKYRLCLQVRALLYTSTLTNAIMETMASVEAAVMRALAHQTTLYPRPPAPNFSDYHQQIARASQPVHEALSMSGFSGRQWDQELQAGNGMLAATHLHGPVTHLHGIRSISQVVQC